jgi:IS605 OrfB family transposase
MESEDYQTFTYQTRFATDEASAKILNDCATLFSHIERKLFVDLSAGKLATDLKSQYLRKYQITGRHFNAIRVQIEGKIASIKEQQPERLAKTNYKIQSVQKTIQKLEKKARHKKKAQLKEESFSSHSRMLSSLAYNNIKSHLKRRAWKNGVRIAEVNPAFTSVIGRVKFAKRYGLSIHHAAALTIGRRCLKFSEKVPRHLDSIPDGKGDHVALSLPVRNADKHVWSTWRILDRKLKTVLAAHFRAKRIRSLSSKQAPEIHPDYCRRNSGT